MNKYQLRKYGDIAHERKQIERQLEEIETALYSPRSTDFSGMPHSPSPGNTTEALAIKHVQLQDLYSAKLEELLVAQFEIEVAISKVKDAELRMLLRHRYIECLKWEEICVVMAYSWTHIHRLHNEALIAIEEF